MISAQKLQTRLKHAGFTNNDKLHLAAWLNTIITINNEEPKNFYHPIPNPLLN